MFVSALWSLSLAEALPFLAYVLWTGYANGIGQATSLDSRASHPDVVPELAEGLTWVQVQRGASRLKAKFTADCSARLTFRNRLLHAINSTLIAEEKELLHAINSTLIAEEKERIGAFVGRGKRRSPLRPQCYKCNSYAPRVRIHLSKSAAVEKSSNASPNRLKRWSLHIFA